MPLEDIIDSLQISKKVMELKVKRLKQDLMRYEPDYDKIDALKMHDKEIEKARVEVINDQNTFKNMP